MATAGDVAQLALKRILVQAGDAILEPDEYADFFDCMNHYMNALEADGCRLGWTDVDNVADTVTIPKGAIRGLIANMAVEVAPDYQAPVTQQLQNQAIEGLKVMRKLGQSVIETAFDKNLPQGSGNTDHLYRTTVLYKQEPLAILSLRGNTETTEVATTDVAVLVYGFWNVEGTRYMRGSTDGRIQNMTGEDIDVDIEITITATGNSTYTFSLLKNGVSQSTKEATLTSTATTNTITKALTMNPGDYLELWVEDDLATEDLIVTNALFEVS